MRSLASASNAETSSVKTFSCVSPFTMRSLSMVFAITLCAILMHLLVFSSPIHAVGDENLLRELKDVRDSAMSQWNSALLEVTNSRQESTAQLVAHRSSASMRHYGNRSSHKSRRALFDCRGSCHQGLRESINTVASSSRPAPQDRGTKILPVASNKKATVG